jgi:hypothetical protein
MAEALSERRRERARLLGLARTFVDDLVGRVDLVAAAVIGSVARGDFNVWSDVDVLVVAEGLPSRAPDRAGLLLADAPSGVQPVGFEPGEFEEAFRRGDPMTREAVTVGVVLRGADFFRRFRSSSTP